MGQKNSKRKEIFSIPIYYSSGCEILPFLDKNSFVGRTLLKTEDQEKSFIFYPTSRFCYMTNIKFHMKGSPGWVGFETKGVFLMYHLEDTSNGENLLESFEKEYIEMRKIPECKKMKFILIGVKNDFKEEFLDYKEIEAKKFCKKNGIEFGGFIDTKNDQENTRTMEILKKNAEKILGYKIKDEKEFEITDKIKTGKESKKKNYFY